SYDNVLSDDVNTCGLAESDNNLLGVDPQLGPLADNTDSPFSSTSTHALAPTSPAIDHSTACGLGYDQRGVTRLVGPTCDSGAYEFSSFANLTIVKSATPQDGTDFDFTILSPATPDVPIFVTRWGGSYLQDELWHI